MDINSDEFMREAREVTGAEGLSMDERDTVFTIDIGPDTPPPAVGTRMSITKDEERSKPGRLWVKEARPDPDGVWLVKAVTPYEDGVADVYLERAGGPEAALS